MLDAFIFDAVRTPRGRGRPDGALHGVAPLDLAATCLAALRERNALTDGAVEDVVLGVASPVGEQGGDIARFAALHAGFGRSVAGLQVHRFCASGLDACAIAAAKAHAGSPNLMIGGGVESMSRVPMGSDGGAMTEDPRVVSACSYVPQGISADLIASLRGFDRATVDGYAAESQRRAARAWEEGRFARAIVPVLGEDGAVLLDRDEHLRPGTTVERLATLPPAFADLGAQGYDAVALARYPEAGAIAHVHHGGNSAGIVDGASAVLVGNSQSGQRHGLAPRARVVAMATAAGDPTIMLTAPEEATARVLDRARLRAGDIDIWEVNEAFACVPLWFADVMEIEKDRLNVNGGAIAMGHPLGATGAILLGMAVDELERRNKELALVTLCAAGGQAAAVILSSC